MARRGYRLVVARDPYREEMATRAMVGCAVLCLVACGGAETTKPGPAQVAAEQASPSADVFGVQPDAAPPATDGPMLLIDLVDASAPISSSWPSPPPAPKDPCGDNGSTLRRLGSDPAPPAPATTPFDRRASAAALERVNVSECARPGGPLGSGHVKVTFASSGNVTTAEVDSPPFGGTAVGGCIAGKFRAARVPAFGGGCVTIGKSLTLR
jgi:hypothetical protein